MGCWKHYYRYYRKWLHIPISGNITHFSLPKKMLDFNIKTARQIQGQCKLSARWIIKTSWSEEIRTCIALPVKMLNLILSSNLLEYLKTVKLNSTQRKLYRNNISNLHGTVSLISTKNLELLDHSSNNFSPIHSWIGRM